jgi:hypothetical protein
MSCRKAYLSRQNRDFLQWNAESASDTEKFEIVPIGHDQYNIKSPAGQYLSAMPDGELTIERRQAGEWEAFTITQVGPGVFSIRTVHGKYVCAQAVDKAGRIRASADEVRDLETFAIEPLNSSKYSGPRKVFCSRGKKYLSAQENGAMMCDRSHHRRWEEFNLFPLGRSQYYLQSYMWTKYLTVDGSDVVTAHAPSPTPSGVFTIEGTGDETVAIKTARGNYMVAMVSGAIEANRQTADRSELFSILSPNPPKFAGPGRRLKSSFGYYLCAQRDGRLEWSASWFSSLFGASQRFEFIAIRHSKYHIKTPFGTWLSVNEKFQLIGKQVDEPGEEEVFIVKPVNADCQLISIRTSRGRYLSGRENGMTDATRRSIGELEVIAFS